jgi:hypothetical protein
MHARKTTRPVLLALIANPITDVNPDDPLTPALAQAISDRIPGSYVEEDENGEPRVCYPASWLSQCGHRFDSIIASLDNDIEGMRRDLGLVA